MLRFDEATLVYVKQFKAENGSPKEETRSRTIKVQEVKNVSLNYYLLCGDNQRIMRLSKNLVVPRWTTEDIIEDENAFELMYVDYRGKRYRVQEILRQFRTNTRVLLDIEELR